MNRFPKMVRHKPMEQLRAGPGRSAGFGRSMAARQLTAIGRRAMADVRAWMARRTRAL